MNSFLYPNRRPKLVIERTGGKVIGRCYEEDSWKITSTFRLSAEKIKALNGLGLIGFGQEFIIRSKCDGSESPAGVDVVECEETTAHGIVVNRPGMNPYSGKPYKPVEYPYFVYECLSRCDSGD